MKLARACVVSRTPVLYLRVISIIMQNLWKNHKFKVILGGIITYGAATGVFYQMKREKKTLSVDIQRDGDNPSNEKRKLVFDFLSLDYDDKIDWDEWMLSIHKRRKNLLSHCNGNVLEVSIGTGRNFKYYPQKVDGKEYPIKSITGIDYSTEMMIMAQHKAKEAPCEVKLYNMSNEKIGFADSTFDTIVDTFGVCSVHNPIAMLHELARVCKEDGKILLLEHGMSKWSWITSYLNGNVDTHVQTWGCTHNRDIKQLVLEAGLTIEEYKTHNFGTTYYIVARPNKNITQ